MGTSRCCPWFQLEGLRARRFSGRHGAVWGSCLIILEGSTNTSLYCKATNYGVSRGLGAYECEMYSGS